jgi:hypothetical protein
VVRSLRRRLAADERRLAVAGVAMIAVGYLFALGFVSPTWHVRLPLSFIADWIRPVAAIRSTQRFSLVVYMGVLILSILGLQRVIGAFSRDVVRRGLVGLVCALYLAEIFPVKLPISAKERFVFTESDLGIERLQRTVSRPLVVLHLPIYHFRQRYPISEATYMTGSTLHWARIMNGFAGEFPNGFSARMAHLDHFPADEAWDVLTRFGVDLVAVHPEISADSQRDMIESVRAHGGTVFTVGPNEQLLSICSRGAEPALGCQ